MTIDHSALILGFIILAPIKRNCLHQCKTFCLQILMEIGTDQDVSEKKLEDYFNMGRQGLSIVLDSFVWKG
jgi:hypothetical protein